MAEQPVPSPEHHNNPIPPAIRRQAEQAERLQRESTGQADQPETPAQPPAPAPQPPPPPPPQPPQPPAADDATAQLRATQGRLDAEREKRQQLEGQVGNLNRMVGELQAQLRSPPPTQADPQRGKLVTAEEEADYGADLMTVIGKRARDEVAGEIDTLKEEIRKLNGQLGQVGSRVWQREEEDLQTQLQRAVPGWLEQNSDANFIQWLQQPEPFSGIKRHDLLTRAYDLQDADRVIRFFQGYLDEAAVTGQVSQPAPSAPNGSGKVPLETFAAPGRAAPAPAAAPPGSKPTYTRAQISQFYTDKAAGKWRGREVDAAAQEADIFRAGPEGRVVG